MAHRVHSHEGIQPGRFRARCRFARPRVLVIIPAHDEAGRVAGVIADVRAHVVGCDVLVVDDGSRDTTAARRAAPGRSSSPCRRSWLRRGARDGRSLRGAPRYDVVGQIDGDGQHRAEHLVRLLETPSGSRAWTW